MGGPSVGIPLRQPLTSRQRADLDLWLRSVAYPVQEAEAREPFGLERGWKFGVPNVRKLGIYEDDEQGGCMTNWIMPAHELLVRSAAIDDLSMDDLWLLAEQQDEQEPYIASLGFYPEYHIGLSTMCNRPIDHRVLGHLALHLAEQHGGLVNMNGALAPPLSPGRNTRAIADYPWSTLEEISVYVHQFPGRVFEIYHTHRGGARRVHHIVDVEFFRAWLEHPDFRMIK